MSRSLADQRRASERYGDIVQRISRGELDPGEVQAEFLRFAAEAGMEYARDLAELSSRYFLALLDIGRSYNDRFYEQVLPSARPMDSRPAPPEPRQVVLDLSGQLGREITTGFVIENKRSSPANISFVVSDCVDTSGGAPFRPPLTLEPQQLMLRPHHEAQIRLLLPLPPELFKAGHQYRAKIAVRGYDDLELFVKLAVQPAAEPATRASAATAPPGAQPARKKRTPTSRASKQRAQRREKKAEE